MEPRATRLTTYLRSRVGDSLRGVGYHTPETSGVVYIRDDVAEQYPPDRVDRLVDVSRSVGDALGTLDEIGRPEASLHRLEDALLGQFHVPGEGVVFIAVDADVGRNFNQFVDDCLAQLS